MFSSDIKVWDATKDPAPSATQAYAFNGDSFELIIPGSPKVRKPILKLDPKPALSTM